MNKIKDKGITAKFLLYFTLIVVLPISLINIFSMSIYKNIAIDNATELIQQQQKSVATNLDNELKNYNRILAAIVYNSKSVVLDEVTNIHRASDPKDKYDLTESMDQKIQLIMHASNNIDGVYFIFNDSGYYYYNNPLVGSAASIKELQLYKDSLLNPDRTQKGKLTNGITTDSDGRYTLLFGVHPSMSSYRNDVEVVLLSAYTDVLPKSSTNIINDKHGTMHIIDANGEVMYSENHDIEGENVSQIDGLKNILSNDLTSYADEVNGEAMLVNVYEMKDVGWRIVNLVSQSYVTKQADSVTTISLFINIGMILSFVLFTIFFFRGMIKPINELIYGMNQIENEKLDYRLTIGGNEEIQRLGYSFNVMAARIEQLIIDNQIKEQEKMQAEIDALQSQINPHFIVNSLSTIKFMSMVSKNESIQVVSEMLMKILNTSFRNRSHFNKVEEELELVKSYINIMLIRYGNNFDVRYKIDESILNFQILKLILQPIVENSITHGLSEKEGLKSMVIKVYRREELLVIEVIDNGVGMKPSDIANVFVEDKTKIKDKRHIGMINILNRIILNHGSDYGIELSSVVNRYMKVKMYLPLIQEPHKEVMAND